MSDIDFAFVGHFEGKTAPSGRNDPSSGAPALPVRFENFSLAGPAECHHVVIKLPEADVHIPVNHPHLADHTLRYASKAGRQDYHAPVLRRWIMAITLLVAGTNRSY